MHFIFGFWDFKMKMHDNGLCVQCGECLGHASLKCNVGVCKGLTKQRNFWLKCLDLDKVCVDGAPWTLNVFDVWTMFLDMI